MSFLEDQRCWYWSIVYQTCNKVLQYKFVACLHRHSCVNLSLKSQSLAIGEIRGADIGILSGPAIRYFYFFNLLSIFCLNQDSISSIVAV